MLTKSASNHMRCMVLARKKCRKSVYRIILDWENLALNTANWSITPAECLESKNRKFFTVAQANRSLVLLQRIVGEVVREYNTLLELEEQIEQAEQVGSVLMIENSRQRLVATVDNLQGCLEELDQLGVELRDFSRGIVDFPAEHEGRTIRLCWLLGESDVSHWHERDAGFACRQPIALLDQDLSCLSQPILL